MKKSVKIAGIVLGVGIVFSAGGIVGANLDWKTGVINNAYSDFLTTASATTNELTANIDSDLALLIESKVNGNVELQKAELERLLEEYYQMKLDSMASSEEITALEAEIEQIRNSVLTSYQQQIDQAFEGK